MKRTVTKEKLLKIFLFVIVDIIAVALAGFFANFIRAEMIFSKFLAFEGTKNFLKILPFLTFLTLIVSNIFFYLLIDRSNAVGHDGVADTKKLLYYLSDFPRDTVRRSQNGVPGTEKDQEVFQRR